MVAPSAASIGPHAAAAAAIERARVPQRAIVGGDRRGGDGTMTTRALPWILALGVGCGTDGAEHGATDPQTTGGTSGVAETSAATNVPGSTGSEAPETGASSTSGAATGDSGSTGPAAEESSTGEAPIQLCGLEDLKAGAPNPVVSGTEPMQIPPDIGTILVDNCGCHYADMLDVGPPVADYSELLPLRIETWEQWQGEYGILTIKPTLGSCLARVRDAPLGTTMPHRSCHVGDGERMDPAQRQILIAWMEAGAPDGATWIPP